jgi:hypothetical protein
LSLNLLKRLQAWRSLHSLARRALRQDLSTRLVDELKSCRSGQARREEA